MQKKLKSQKKKKKNLLPISLFSFKDSECISLKNIILPISLVFSIDLMNVINVILLL